MYLAMTRDRRRFAGGTVDEDGICRALPEELAALRFEVAD
jgi:hypothetical protein